MCIEEVFSLKILLWPFLAIWSLVGFLLSLTGRFLAAILGLALIFAGSVLTITVIGAFVGIPLIILGGALFLRALF